ncbi:Terminase small subunit [Acinetobacter baumannii]|uniref:hypothetical protein n=1 Tax=Acinetobacter baumannii TaxID=470 RepID=UPI000DE6CFF4|nr:hypothetical protein [Acinetobacter baumannii]SSQ30112.1 Terminase small subunit [Acinetobacter baumannii]
MEEQIKGAEPLENERHEKFCQALLASPSFSITDAGTAAGYKHRQNAWDVYKIPKVQERIKYLKSMLMEELGVDQYFVVKNLRDIAQMAMKEGEYSAANKANELLGKHTGLFTEKVEHKHSGSVDMNLKVVFEDDGETSTK